MALGLKDLKTKKTTPHPNRPHRESDKKKVLRPWESFENEQEPLPPSLLELIVAKKSQAELPSQKPTSDLLELIVNR